MKNKYKIFNDTYIKEDEYENIILSEEEKNHIKNRMNAKINNKKTKHKKKMLVASIPFLIAASVAMTSETTWAYLKEVGKQIEEFLGRNEEEFKGYKVEVNQISEEQGIKINLKEIMLDDGQLILNIDMDYSNFDTSAYKIKKNTIYPNIPDIIINDRIYPGGSGSVYNENSEEENVKSFLIKAELTVADTDGDGIGDTQGEVLENIKENEDYNIKIVFNGINYETKSNLGNIIGSGGSGDTSDATSTDESFNIGEIKGNWEFETIINGTNIMKDTKVEKLNKEIVIDKDDIKATMIIEEVRVSPVSAKVRYNLVFDENNKYDEKDKIVLNIYDEKGNMLSYSGGGIGDENRYTYNFEYELKGKEKKLILKPCIYDDDKPKDIKTEKIEINLP